MARDKEVNGVSKSATNASMNSSSRRHSAGPRRTSTITTMEERRHSTASPRSGTITTRATKGTERRHSAVPAWDRTITTGAAKGGQRRHNIARPADEMITTVCGCGTEFHPTTPRQKHCSPQCRKRVYEKTDKASARRSRYWNTTKGSQTRDRYQRTGATARNNRTYRQRLRKYYETFLALKEKHGYKKLTVKLLFGNGENQIPERAAYRIFELLNHRYYWRDKFMWRPDPNGHWKWKFPIDDRLCTELLEFVFGITSAEGQPAETVTA